MSDALIREVQEDLQRDRAIAWAKRYGGYVALLLFALIAGTAGYVAWNHWQTSVRSEESARLLAAVGKLDRGDAAAALPELLAVADGTSDGVAAIARFQAAQAALRDSKPDQVSEILQSLAGGKTEDPILRDAAAVGAIGRRLDAGDPAALINELQPLTGADRPFRHQARELLALAHVRAGNLAAAKSTFDDAIKDPSLPMSARARLAELRAALEIGT